MSEAKPHSEFDDEELAELEEQMEDDAEMAKLTQDKAANYSMLRKLKPVTNSNSYAVMGLTSRYSEDYFGSLKKLLRFKEWTDVEDGKIQIRESSDPDDMHGYVVVRPTTDLTHEIIIRIFDEFPNSAIIIPRSDEPLPRQGKAKNEIMEKMVLVSGKELDNYTIWLDRLRK